VHKAVNLQFICYTTCRNLQCCCNSIVAAVTFRAADHTGSTAGAGVSYAACGTKPMHDGSMGPLPARVTNSLHNNATAVQMVQKDTTLSSRSDDTTANHAQQSLWQYTFARRAACSGPGGSRSSSGTLYGHRSRSPQQQWLAVR
jgi:hypothetical protein